MRILIVRVIIRRGTLETDTIILRRSLPWVLIVSLGWIVRRWVTVGLRVSLGRSRGIAVLGLTRGTRWTKGLTMGTVQHWWLITVPGIAVFARPVLTSNRSSCVRTIHSRSRDECSLRRDGMEQTLLVEADTVLASSVRRAVIA